MNVMPWISVCTGLALYVTRGNMCHTEMRHYLAKVAIEVPDMMEAVKKVDAEMHGGVVEGNLPWKHSSAKCTD